MPSVIIPQDSAGQKSMVPAKDSLMFDLVLVEDVVPGIRSDLKYASADNFMGMKLYQYWNKPMLQRFVALKLLRAQNRLKTLDSSLNLFVYDAARPVAVQRRMWLALDSIPPKERGKFVSSPYNKSLHNFGCAVDITLCDSHGIPVDMGAKFDDIRTIAYPSMEVYFLGIGLLTVKQVENRRLLRKVMHAAGFTGIPTEWWHFNGCTKEYALKHVKLINEEAPFSK